MEHRVLLRFAVGYHAVLGATLLLLPYDVLSSLGLEQPPYWLPYIAASMGPIAAACLLEWAYRDESLRRGLVAAVVVGNGFAAAAVILDVTAEGLAWTLYGPGVAAVLWAYLLWDVVSPRPQPSSVEEPPKEPGPEPLAPVEPREPAEGAAAGSDE